jgi:hypothetical protein
MYHSVSRGDGTRLYYPNNSPTVKGIYNNDPHTLIRFDTIAALEERFTLVLSQINKKRDTYFTISIFSSMCPFRFHVTPGLPQHQVSWLVRWYVLFAGLFIWMCFHINCRSHWTGIGATARLEARLDMRHSIAIPSTAWSLVALVKWTCILKRCTLKKYGNTIIYANV